MKKLLLTPILMLLVSILFSCSDKNKDDPNPISNRKVTFEITGNYSGQLTVVINSSGVSGGLETVTVTSLPWTLTKEYPNDILAVGLGGSSASLGATGQAITASIKIGNVTKSQSQAATDVNGGISIATITHVFQ